MTVDVEDYFQVSAFDTHIGRGRWDEQPSRVEANVERILELFEDADARATFFTLAWIAERHPAMVRSIVAAGHELASHGCEHIRVTGQTPDEFRADARRSKAVLEEIGGVEVTGYRAASFSIGQENLWALEVLAEVGYRYSSSIYPVRHDHYGMPEAPRFAFRHPGGLLEVPVSTVRLMGRNWPCGGGGYFRLLPYRYYRWAFRRLNDREGQPGVFYFHPWELDPEQPRQDDLPLKTRFRHYHNLDGMERDLKRLLADFRWDRMDQVFSHQLSVVNAR
ncbi:MAG: DUF3473 domain-containing protein [Gammaproteobacteria bacterium]|nr:MAG: DUF3473 domain-containing protein [Gammaproteobacteria bacterium]